MVGVKGIGAWWEQTLKVMGEKNRICGPAPDLTHVWGQQEDKLAVGGVIYQ